MIDRLVAVILIILICPLFILITLIYFLLGNNRILFSQLRLGHKEKPFRLYKFKTLKDIKGRPLEQRKFLYGSLLRRSSLDELPQLFNVLKGDMSLVGPRPLPVEYQALFSDEQRLRFQVKPGITGLVQINGGTNLAWPKKFAYDLEYVNNHSFWGDMIILFKTLGVVFSKKEDGLKEQPFKGEE